MKKLLVFIIACAISGCITGGSMEYRPLNAKEKEAFDKSDRTVFPDDVRQALDKYKETTVAWTGIIEEIRMIETEGYIERIILCRHYYYDWIESLGPGTSRIWLSPKGEGDFAVYLRSNRTFSHEQFIEILAKNKEEDQKSVGNMLIVYGKPGKIENEVIYLVPWYYEREIGRMWFEHTPEMHVYNDRDKTHGR